MLPFWRNSPFQNTSVSPGSFATSPFRLGLSCEAGAQFVVLNGVGRFGCGRSAPCRSSRPPRRRLSRSRRSRSCTGRSVRKAERSNTFNTTDLDRAAVMEGPAAAGPMAWFGAAREATEVVGGAVALEATMARARSARKRFLRLRDGV
jgi:hypothetical protein